MVAIAYYQSPPLILELCPHIQKAIDLLYKAKHCLHCYDIVYDRTLQIIFKMWIWNLESHIWCFKRSWNHLVLKREFNRWLKTFCCKSQCLRTGFKQNTFTVIKVFMFECGISHWIGAILPTAVSAFPISPIYYRLVPIHLLMQNVTQTRWTVETSCTSL